MTAARELLAEGTMPTVADAATRAAVSRTTAYRYFPTQDALLLEVAVNVDVDEIEALVAAPVDPTTAAARTLDVIQRLNGKVLGEEVQYRTTMRLYLDLWLTAYAAGDTDPVVREGRRRRWLAQTLDPLRASMPEQRFERLVAALSLVGGFEAMFVLRDICRMDTDDALEVTRWAAEVLLEAALEGRPAGTSLEEG